MVALESWERSAVAYHPLGGPIDFDRSDAGLDHCPQLLQNFTHQLARRPHLVELFFGLPDNHTTQ